MIANSILDNLKEVVFSVSPDNTRGLYFSPSAQVLLSCAVGDLLQNPTLRYAHVSPADRLIVTAAWQLLLKTGEMEVEYALHLPSGVQWLHEHATLVRDANGALLRVDGLIRNVTRRKVHADSQSRTNQRLSKLIEQLPMGAAIVCNDRISMNRALRDMLLLSNDDVRTTDDWLDKVLADDNQSWINWVDSNSASTEPMLWNLLRGDGRRRKLECSRSVLSDQEQVWVLRDVTESDREHRLLQQICEKLRVGGWELDCHTQELYWSPTVYSIHEVSPQTYVPDVVSAVDFYAPESIDQIRTAVEKGIANGEGWDLNLELITGAMKRISVRAQGDVEIVDGTPSRLYGAFHEISEQVRTQHELEAVLSSARLFEQLFDLTNALVIAITPDRQVLKANRAFETLLGIPVGQILDPEQEFGIHPDDQERCDRCIENLLESQNSISGFDMRLRDSTGRYRWFSWSAALDPATSVIYGVAVEISERKQNESVEKARNRILDRMLAEAPLREVLEQTCRELCELIAHSRTSVLLLSEGGGLHHAGSVGLPQFYLDAIDGIRPGVGVGSCGHAAATQSETFVADVMSHEYWSPFAALAEQTGFRACWSNPILDDQGDVLGAFAVYRDYVSEPTELEVYCLRTLTRIAALAVTTQRTRDSKRAAELRFRTLFEGSPDATWQVNEDGIIQAVNSASVVRYGFSADEMVGMHVRQFAAPELLADVQNRVSVAMTSGARFEWIHIDKNGERIPVEISSNPVVIDGRTGCVSVIRDIREHKRQIAEIKASKELLERSQSAAKIGSWEWDPATGVIQWSEETFRLLAWPREQGEPTFEQLLTLYQPADADELAGLVNRALTEGVPYFVEHRVFKDGEFLRWLECRGCPVLDESGKVVGLHGTVQDITERKLIQDQLRLSDERFSAFMENIPVLAYMRDAEGRYIYTNKATVNEFPNLADCIGKTPYDVWPRERAESILHGDAEILHQRTPFIEEVTTTDNGRTKTWMIFRFLVPGFTDNGGTLGVAAIDITELRKSEAALTLIAARLQRAQDTAKLGWWTVETGSMKLAAADDTYRLFGCDPLNPPSTLSELIACFPPDTGELIVDRFSRSFAGELLEPVTFCVGVVEGSSRWLEGRCSPEFDEHGGIVRMVGTVQDVSERREVMLRLQESEARFSAFMENLPILAYMRDGDGKYLWVNEAKQSEFDLKTTYVGKSIEDVWPPKRAKRIREEDQRVLDSGEALQLESETESSEGKKHWMTFKFPVPTTRGECVVGVAGIDITELRKTEAELRRLANRLEQAQKTAHLGWITTDLRTGESNWSSEACSIFELEPDSPRPSIEDLLASLPEDSRLALENGLDRVLKGEVVGPITYHRIRQDGTEQWLEGRCEPECQESGAITGLNGTVQDVTERVVASQKLEEANRKYRVIFESVPDAVFLIDTSGSIVDVNRVAESRYGYRRDELVGTHISVLTPPARTSVVEQRLEQCLASVTQFEGQHLTKDGKVLDIDVHSSPIQLNGRNLCIAAVRDITERKRTEAILIENEARFRAISEASPLGMFVTRADGYCLYTNGRMSQILETQPDYLLGNGWLNFAHGNHRRCVQKEWLAALRERRAFQITVELTSGTGSTRVISSNAAPILAGDDLVGFVGCMEDVTDRLLLQQELQDARHLESVGRLAGGIAHDFNNLLTAVIGFAELAEDKLEPGSPARTDIEKVCNAAERAALLTRQLLGFARKQVQAPVETDLGADLFGCVEILERVAGKQVTLKMEIGERLWPVRVDPVQMRQIYMNLAANARDAMPDGGTLRFQIENFVRCREGAAPEEFVRFSITDTGTGIEPEVLERIFEPFFTTKPIGKGTGLGLSMVYGIVQQSGGEIRCLSTPGIGTSIEILLPRMVEQSSMDGGEQRIAA